MALTRQTPSSAPLLDFIPLVSPRFQRPYHLAPIADRLERFREEPFDFVVSVPVRHGKSQLLLHFIVWAMLRHPALRIAYVTCNASLAKKQARLCRKIASAAGLQLANKEVRAWVTPEGGTCDWQGIGGTLVGLGYDLIIIDDPVKNRKEAESRVVRDVAWDFYQSDCVTRLEPGGSFLCNMARWHEDDLAGRLTTPNPSEDWPGLPYVNLPAISDEGGPDEKALWPERWPLEALRRRKIKVGPYSWVSLYQGQPRPRGAKVFADVFTFEKLPPQGYRHAIGIDLAYTSKSSADHSVALALLRGQKDGLNYLVEVDKAQVPAPQFKRKVRALQVRHPTARVRWYCSGTEKGSADFFEQQPDAIRNFEAVPASSDKFIRAQPVAAAWNKGNILCQDGAPWLPDFLRVVNGFTGLNDKEDDDVDALAAGFDLLEDPRNASVSLGPGISAPRRA